MESTLTPKTPMNDSAPTETEPVDSGPILADLIDPVFDGPRKENAVFELKLNTEADE